METFGGASIFLIPLGYGLFAFGLLAWGLSMWLKTQDALNYAGLGALLLAALKWHELASLLMARWTASHRRAIAQDASQAAHFNFIAGAYVPPVEEEPEPEPDPAPQLVTVNTSKGSYQMPKLSPAEARQAEEIAQCLRFLTIGQRAGKFSMRAMREHKPPTMSDKDFEAWWTGRGDQLVAWGLFAKAEKSGTRPALPLPEIRTALLSRNLPGLEKLS